MHGMRNYQKFIRNKGIKLYEMMVKKFEFVIRSAGVEVKLEMACYLEASPFCNLKDTF